MAANLITSLLSLGASLFSYIRTSLHDHEQASSSSNDNSEIHERQAVEENLEKLMQTLKRIKATLYDAGEKVIRDRSDKLWLQELRRITYDAEYVLSEYQYEAKRVQVEALKASEASGSHKIKQMEYIVPIPDGMLDRLSKIRDQFAEIAKDREALHLRKSDMSSFLENRTLQTPTGHMVDDLNIFGRDAEVTKVIDLLLMEIEKHFSVISIVGKGGLGKTTIAQLVYKDQRVRLGFDLFVWVYVSKDLNVETIIRATIESVTKNSCNLNELSPLQEKLAEHVKERNILLVLDDVWNENQSLWELFQTPLKKAKMVRVLVTTRNEKVADIMQTSTSFKPSYLSEHYCWQLFQHYAFDSTTYNVPTHYVEIGRDIMKKCGGLPLAVKSIASLLRHEVNEKSWREILESDLWESEPLNDIFPALQISYAHLPVHLKPCFLFCSMYPKDYVLKKMKLIQLWISHGYIEARGKRDITQTGIEYYEELKRRSFLDDFSNKNSECCKLHDIMHDLARLNSENENYSMDINQPLDINEGNILRETYHLYATGFMGYVNQIPQQNLKGLRTLCADLRGCSGALEHEYCISSAKARDVSFKLPTNYIDCFGNASILNLTKFEALRVLELKEAGRICLREIPDCIAQLKRLFHLRITSRSLEMLPLSIGLLYNLQIFILDCWDSPLKYLPESICYLTHLRYICIKCRKIKQLPKKLCLLNNLLKLIVMSNYLEQIPSDLRRLSYLQELKIGSDRIQALPDSVSYLNGLMKLELFVGDLFQELPTAVGNLKKLEILKIHCSINFSFSYKPHVRENFPKISRMETFLRVRTIGWLKDMKNLEGELIIERLGKICDLVDARCAIMRMRKIGTLVLCWHDYHKHSIHSPKRLRIRLTKEPNESKADGRDTSVDLLQCLQPPPLLKKLELQGYPSAKVPNWMGSPTLLQSIQEIRLIGCDGIQSLSFRNLHTLKHLRVQDCSGIQLLRLEHLPSQLESLEIWWCEKLKLITGLWNLGLLAKLQVVTSGALRSITLDELPAVELKEYFGSSSHESPCHGRQINSSVKRLVRVQPHRYLKKLVLDGYPSPALPHWAGNPFCLQAIQKIRLQGCDGLQSLPFCNLHTLKHLEINWCSCILFLQLEQLPSKLETLQILWCNKLMLIAGLRTLGMLTSLRITDCKALKSITMDELLSAKVTKPFVNSSHKRTRDSWLSTSSLTRLRIEYCPLLADLPSELTQCGPCNVWVHDCGCPDLEFGN